MPDSRIMEEEGKETLAVPKKNCIKAIKHEKINCFLTKATGYRRQAGLKAKVTLI